MLDTNYNFLVIKFHDNDFTWDFEQGLRLLWSMYGIDTKRHVQALQDRGQLKDSLVYLFDYVGMAMGVIHDMRMCEWSSGATEQVSKRDYISSLEVLFFKSKSDFIEWRNGEWVYLDLSTGECAAF